jgi:hypothetical protein
MLLDLMIAPIPISLLGQLRLFPAPKTILDLCYLGHAVPWIIDGSHWVNLNCFGTQPASCHYLLLLHFALCTLHLLSRSPRLPEKFVLGCVAGNRESIGG